MSLSDKTGGEAAVLSDQHSFERIVEESCNRLWDTKVRYSIRQIHELEELLNSLEQDLDAFLEQHTPSA
jgi:hypothetical protein